jgi:hypothetical protein
VCSSDLASIDDIDSLDEDLFVEIFNKLCDIEFEELLNTNATDYSDFPERCKMAIDIQDYMALQIDWDDDLGFEIDEP